MNSRLRRLSSQLMRLSPSSFVASNAEILFKTVDSVRFRDIFPKSTLLFGITHFSMAKPSSHVRFYIIHPMVCFILIASLVEVIEWLNQQESIVLSVPSYLENERKNMNQELTKRGHQEITV